ncbi:MAG TPA: cupin-like domain-containing protein [Chitinophagaceae bacterium]|nr:cupin-like domain-containing protein [Chitinophagaceae bacterium]
MRLEPVTVLETIDPEVFRRDYYHPGIPVIIKDTASQWPAIKKWNWDYFKDLVGDKKVPIYNNVKSDAYTPINSADDYKTFGEYIDMIRSGPAAWRIFLFNIFDHAPQLINDFAWPEHLMKGFIKKYPMLFTGGATSITHMHFDIDLSHILHTQFGGRKRVLMFPFKEQHKLYRKPFEVLSLADFSNYYENNGTPDYSKFPALKLAEGYDFILEPGDTLFMPSGYWHHMEYIESGFALSLRAFLPSLGGKLKGAWNLIGMRNIDTVMKKTAPKWWYERKKKKVFKLADRELRTVEAV